MRGIWIWQNPQVVYEDIFLSILDNLYKKYKCENLSLSGGCAMNSVINGKIVKNTSFKNIYISQILVMQVEQ